MSDLGINVIRYGVTAIIKNVENFVKRHVTNAQPLNAKIRNLQNGTIIGVNYVKNMSDLGINVIRYGVTAIIKNVKNFAKRHVTIANHHFHTLSTLTTNIMN